MPGPSRRSGGDGATLVSPRLLRRWALPQPDEADDKEGRGRVLVVGGAPQMPGAVILAATAALRAGVGKLRIATVASVAQAVGVAVPEALVVALPETKAGGIDPKAADSLVEYAGGARATLIGPGLVDEDAVHALLARVAPRIEQTTLVLDAAALTCGCESSRLMHDFPGEAVVTPHAGEMATLLGIDKAAVRDDPLASARRAARELGAVVALKGSETHIAAPDGEAYLNRAGNVGLATSGSGDTLAGIVAGLAARGASPLQAAVWGVHLHAGAGDRLADRICPLGFLARELLEEVPAVMVALHGRRRSPATAGGTPAAG